MIDNYNKVLLIGAFCMIGVSGFAQSKEEADTVGKTQDLQEIVVEAVTQKVRDDGVEYIPGKKVKNSSYNAASLLANMQMPQVIVSPFDGSIKTAAGDGYAIYINYVPVSEEDMQALLPEDVLKVEVLSASQDPRFSGSRNVINIIMRRHEWGAYTKLMATGIGLSDDIVRGSVYQKVSRRKWSFDVSASALGSWNHKSEQSMRETFRDFTYNGIHYDELSREAMTDNVHRRNNSESATARAMWDNNGSTLISHTISFSRQATPRFHYNTSMTYDGDFLFPTEAVSDSWSQSLNAALSGMYRFLLPHDNFVSMSWTFSHSGNKGGSTYSPLGGMEIANSNRERSYSPSGAISYQKGLSHNNSIGFFLNSINTIYDTDYFGSYTGRQDFFSGEEFLWLCYSQYWPFGLYLNGGVGGSLTLGRLNGKFVNKKLSPRLEMELQYRFCIKHSLLLEAWMFNSHPTPTATNTALVRTDELLWMEGNPDLRTSGAYSLGVTYSFIPNNRLSLIGGARYTNSNHSPTFYYKPFMGGDGIIRTLCDDNRHQETLAFVNGSLKLFNNSLMILASCNFHHQIWTGVHHQNATDIGGYIDVKYYLGSFSFRGFYSTPSKSLSSSKGGFLYRMPAKMGVEVGYGARNLNVSISYRNWFGNGHVRESYNTSYYSTSGWKWDNTYAPQLAVTLTYTFKYGKKIDQSDDVENNAVKKTAVLE